jgi:hypothetical protein
MSKEEKFPFITLGQRILPMQGEKANRAREFVPEVVRALGPLAPLFQQGRIAVTGGTLIRLYYGGPLKLGLGHDLDLIVLQEDVRTIREDLDWSQDPRTPETTAWAQYGGKVQRAQVTGGGSELVGGRPLPSLDLLVQVHSPAKSVPVFPAAHAFVQTFDFCACQQFLAMVGTFPLWGVTGDGLWCLREKIPGWRRGLLPSKPGRKEKWEAYFAGLRQGQPEPPEANWAFPHADRWGE